MKRHFFLIASILTVLSLSIGCNKPPADEKPPKGSLNIKQDGKNIDIDIKGPKGGNIKIKTGESEVKLPSNFPKDVPIPPEAKLKSHAKIGTITTIVLETSASLSDILNYYKKTLLIKGWKVEASVDTPAGSVIGANKKNRTLNVTIGTRDNITIITVSMGS